jgi:hypothetical protein
MISFSALKEMKEVAKDESGGAPVSRQNLSKHIVAVENDVPGVKLDITDEDLKKAKRGQHEPKPVKPARKRRTVQQARETRPKKVYKPLEEKEMECGKGGGIQSGSIKVNQSESK